MTQIRFNNVSLKFTDVPLLEDVNFSIEKRDRIAIIGRNGAGKSTLLKLIQKQLDPDKGNVDIESVFLIARQHLLSGDTRPLNLSVQKDGHGGKYSVRLILKNLPSFRMDTVLGKNIKVEKVSYKNHQGFTYALYLAPNYFYFPVEVVQYKPNGSEQIKLILDKVTLQKSSSCIYRQKKSA